MIFRFGEFELDTDGIRLRSGDNEIAVEPQVFSLLQFLIENHGRVVSKDEIINEVWDGRIVSDTALNTRIAAVRRALGDDGKTQAFIRTFPRRGFWFVSELTYDAPPAAEPPPSMAVPEKPSIAVLPFDNLSHDPEHEYFSDARPIV